MHVSISEPFILLVEDSEDDAFFFQRALRKLGFAGTCVHVQDGHLATEFLERARSEGKVPQLIFLDLKMPKMNGFEFLAWLSKQGFEPPIHVVILSGSDQAGDVQLGRQLGASEYLVKPVCATDLTTTLASLSIASALTKAAA
jgi:CheY-like chemotaxis protein